MRHAVFLFCLAAVPATAADLLIAEGPPVSAMPEAVSNNAVTSVQTGDNAWLISFAGLGAGKEHVDTHAHTFVFDAANAKWLTAPDVPGDAGRLAAVAASAGGEAFVFGGYTVAENGDEVSLPFVHAFDPVMLSFEQRTPMPVPVDDAVAVTYADRYIYLISGWHDFGNVNLVQRYDTQTDTWDQATPTPGPAVFGHAGGIVGNRIVYCDGVAIEPHVDRRRDFMAVDRCFLGLIDSDDGRKIDWRIVPAHPGAPRYRMAAAGTDTGVLFVGGSTNPYNYNGIGYNGEPSQPEPGALFYRPDSNTWQQLPVGIDATMDHRGLVALGHRWMTLGGMLANQRTTNQVRVYVLD